MEHSFFPREISNRHSYGKQFVVQLNSILYKRVFVFVMKTHLRSGRRIMSKHGSINLLTLFQNKNCIICAQRKYARNLLWINWGAANECCSNGRSIEMQKSTCLRFLTTTKVRRLEHSFTSVCTFLHTFQLNQFRGLKPSKRGRPWHVHP